MAERDDPSEQGEVGDAAQAFEALRAEVVRIGRDIGALHTALIEHRGPDLTPTLGEIAKTQQLAAQRLGTLEKHPGFVLTPAQHAQAIATAGAGLMGEAVRTLRGAAVDVQQEGERLGALIGTARSQDKQWNTLIVSGVTAFIAGIVLCPFLVRLLPFGLDEHIAALALHQDRWNGGAQLMAAANPESWRALRIASELSRTNQAALDQCREAAAKAKKAQHCAITVSPAE
jgi:Family of unknown function (DUF6118)